MGSGKELHCTCTCTLQERYGKILIHYIIFVYFLLFPNLSLCNSLMFTFSCLISYPPLSLLFYYLNFTLAGKQKKIKNKESIIIFITDTIQCSLYVITQVLRSILPIIIQTIRTPLVPTCTILHTERERELRQYNIYTCTGDKIMINNRYKSYQVIFRPKDKETT